MLRLAVRVRRNDAELVLAELLELTPGGVEQVDLDEVVEYGVYGAPGELPEMPQVRAACGEALVEVLTTEVGDDWADRWREFHTPLVLAGALTVRPPWEAVGSTEVDVVIDPGRAFGTGAHPTTRLCLELMLELEPLGSFLDLGCGSGVLAITAAKLGFAPVVAVDSDRLAIEATAANAGANSVPLDIFRVDLRHEQAPVAETVAANLLAPLLLELARMLVRAPASSRPVRVIASGLLEREADAVAAEFAQVGLAERGRRELGGWAALLLCA